ncbi:MAG: Gfo/Idh/MocA family oxidoreductase [bacterium]
MKRKINLALIGNGEWGQNYINTIKDLKGITLPEKYIKTTNYKKLFKETGIDGVIIASPTHTHFKIARNLIKRGFNILIEKPLTKNYKEACSLLSLSKNYKNKIIMVGHIQIYDPAYQRMKEYIKKVGLVKKISFEGLQSTPRNDIGPLEDWGPHPIYLFLDLIKHKPQKVSVSKGPYDNINIEFIFPKNIKASAKIGFFSPKKKRILTIKGSEGLLKLDWTKKRKTLTFKGKSNKEIKIKFSDKYSPLAMQILEFTNCLKKKHNPKSGIKEGFLVMEIIEEIKKKMTKS